MLQQKDIPHRDREGALQNRFFLAPESQRLYISRDRAEYCRAGFSMKDGQWKFEAVGLVRASYLLR